MMEFVVLALISILIGAIIGGFTNFVAITMLFRPYHKRYIGKWVLPFTPGVIPKRHQEIATQLGILVEQHLFPPEIIRKKISSTSFQTGLNTALTKEAIRLLSSTLTLNELLTTLWISRDSQDRFFVPGEWLEEQVKETLQAQLEVGWQVIQAKPLYLLFNKDELKLEEKIATVVEYSVVKVKEYLYSSSGEDFLYRSIQQLLERQGSLMNMLGMFFSKEKIIDKIRPQLLVALQQPSTKAELERQVRLMIEEVFEKQVHELIPASFTQQATETIVDWSMKKLAISVRFNQPFAELLGRWEKEILEYIPSLTNLLSEWIAQHVTELMSKLEIAAMVQEQVLSFPLPRLESMIKELATRELKMITWLGAGLGGLIGLVQALIVYFFV